MIRFRGMLCTLRLVNVARARQRGKGGAGAEGDGPIVVGDELLAAVELDAVSMYAKCRAVGIGKAQRLSYRGAIHGRGNAQCCGEKHKAHAYRFINDPQHHNVEHPSSGQRAAAEVMKFVAQRD